MSLVAPTSPSESELRAQICRVGANLFQRGYVHATAGNISVRLPDDQGFLITPTEACLGTLEAARLARVDAKGTQVAGDRASKTLALHRRIYEADPGAHSVVHTHSTHLVALTLQGVWSDDDILPPITPYFVMKVGHVPLIPYHRPGDPRVGELVAARIETMAHRGTPARGDAGPAGPDRVGREPRARQRGARGAGGNRPALADVPARPAAPGRAGDRGTPPGLRRALVKPPRRGRGPGRRGLSGARRRAGRGQAGPGADRPRPACRSSRGSRPSTRSGRGRPAPPAPGWPPPCPRTTPRSSFRWWP